MAIGDFSRATHLSVKALRRYHDVELLSPVEVDRRTGYRFYGTDQVKDAQAIRHLRKLEMPVEWLADAADITRGTLRSARSSPRRAVRGAED